MLYIPSFIKIGTGVQALLRYLLQQILLLLMGAIYEVAIEMA
jgi:hypothetical protein